jgi:hypothetical protein
MAHSHKIMWPGSRLALNALAFGFIGMVDASWVQIIGAGYGGTRAGGGSGCPDRQRCRSVSAARRRRNYKNHQHDGARRRSCRVHFRRTREPYDGQCPSRVIRRGYRLSGNDTNRLRPRRSGRRGRGRNLGCQRERPCGSTATIAAAPASGRCRFLTGYQYRRKALSSGPTPGDSAKTRPGPGRPTAVKALGPRPRSLFHFPERAGFG